MIRAVKPGKSRHCAPRRPPPRVGLESTTHQLTALSARMRSHLLPSGHVCKILKHHRTLGGALRWSGCQLLSFSLHPGIDGRLSFRRPSSGAGPPRIGLSGRLCQVNGSCQPEERICREILDIRNRQRHQPQGHQVVRKCTSRLAPTHHCDRNALWLASVQPVG